MNLRMRKKKYDKYCADKVANITIPFEYVNFIFTAAKAKGIADTYDNPRFQKFVNSLDAKRAVKSKLKKTVWKKYKCKNIDDMYRNMFVEINEEKRYRENLKKMEETIRSFSEEDFVEAGEAWEHKERVLAMFGESSNII